MVGYDCMNGMTNRLLQDFILDTDGARAWRDIAHVAGVPEGGFEMMIDYPPRLHLRVIEALLDHRLQDPESLWEDFGHYHITSQRHPWIRRLLRFGGADYPAFLRSFPEVRSKFQMALPALPLPMFSGVEDALPDGGARFAFSLQQAGAGQVPLLVGVLRAMADDYGALAVVTGQAGRIVVDVLESHFHRGRSFALTRGDRS